MQNDVPLESKGETGHEIIKRFKYNPKLLSPKNTT